MVEAHGLRGWKVGGALLMLVLCGTADLCAQPDEALLATWIRQLEWRPLVTPKTPAAQARLLTEARQGIAALKPPARALVVLRRLISGSSSYGRAEAARTLALMGESARPLLPELLENLRDPRAQVRSATTRALGVLAVDTPRRQDVVSRLTARLDDAAPSVRVAAVEGLGRLGALDGEPQVLRLSDPTWQGETLPTLCERASMERDAVTFLSASRSWHVRAALLQHEAAYVRAPRGRVHLDSWLIDLAAALLRNDRSGAVRQRAARLLGTQAQLGATAAALLRPALVDTDAEVRSAGYAIVGRQGLAADEVVADTLLEALGHLPSQERASVVWVLRGALPTRPDVASALRALLDTEDAAVSDAAAAALLEGGDRDLPLLRHLVQFVEVGGLPWIYFDIRLFSGKKRFELFPLFHPTSTWNRDMLHRVGGKITPLLEQRLVTAGPGGDAHILHALGNTGPTGLAVLRRLSPTLSPEARWIATLVRAHAGDADAALARPLLEALEAAREEQSGDDGELVRRHGEQADVALQKLGIAAVPTLIETLRTHASGPNGLIPDIVSAAEGLLLKVGASARPLLERAYREAAARGDEELASDLRGLMRKLEK